MSQIRTLLVAALALGLGVACSPLAPDDEAARGVSLVLTLDELDASAAQAQCKTPRELAEEVGNVRVTVGIAGSGREPTTTELRVRGVDPTGLLELEGELSLELDPAVPRPVLEVALEYQGRDILGDYSGTIEMESGISVDVSQLAIERVFPAGNVLQADSFVYCLQSASVDEGAPFCSNDEDEASLEQEQLSYGPQRNELLYSYRRSGVNWLDQGVLRTVRVSMTGGFEPMAIYRGTQALEQIALGGGSTVVEIGLTPVAGSGPGTVGERLTAGVLVELVGDATAADRGLMSLRRTAALPCDAEAASP